MKLQTFSLVLDEDGSLDSREMDEALEGCEVLHVWEHFAPAERVWLVMVGYRVAATRRYASTTHLGSFLVVTRRSLTAFFGHQSCRIS